MPNDKPLAPCLMLQGTSSHVGKSVLATAFCRIFSRMGYKVAPFKSQNMANNSYVTEDGCEIGRAQGAQAEAASVRAETTMNPVLLKPSSDGTSQVILNGRPEMEVPALAYREHWIPKLWPHVTEALRDLRTRFDLVIIEGAGSPSEVNLKDSDIANMRVAREGDAKVLLVGDIERGGMLASVVGTLALLPPEEQALIHGVIVNKFRGDKSLLDPGLRFLEEKTGKPILGTIPYIHEKLVADEDSVSLEDRRPSQGMEASGSTAASRHKLAVGVVKLPRISNFTDFDPLEVHPGVDLWYLDLDRGVKQVPGALDCLILPGTKATRRDYEAFVNSKLYKSLQETHTWTKLPILGICGGYQMLGRQIVDHQGIEGKPGDSPGLGLLPLATWYESSKITTRARLTVKDGQGKPACKEIAGVELSGYEIHMGQVAVQEDSQVWLVDERGRPKGAHSQDFRVLGTYLHDIFTNDAFTHWFLSWVWSFQDPGEFGNKEFSEERDVTLPLKKGSDESGDGDKHGDPLKQRMDNYDRLADHVESAIDMETIMNMLKLE